MPKPVVQESAKRESLPRSGTSEIGVTGEMQTSSYYQEERRVDDLKIADLRRMKQNDGQVAMILSAIDNTLLSVGAEIIDDPSLDAGEPSEEKRFIEQNLFSPRWQLGLSTPIENLHRINMRALEEGHVVSEVVYRNDSDGKIRLDRLSPRFTRLSDLEVKIVVDQFGNYHGYHQVTSFQDKAIDVTVLNESDIAKTINVVWGGEYGSNYGRPLLKPVWYHYDKAHKLMHILHIGTELGSVKFRQAKAKGTVGEAKIGQLENMLRRVGIESYIIYNEQDFEITFEDVSDAAVMEVGKGMLEYHTAQMSKAALAQFIDLGSRITGTGARSLGDTQMDFFKTGLQAIGHVLIEQPWNRLIADLCKINFNRGVYPQLKLKPIRDEAAAIIFEVFKTLSTGGNLPPSLKAELYKQTGARLGLDIPDEQIDKEVGDAEIQKQEAADNAAKALQTNRPPGKPSNLDDNLDMPTEQAQRPLYLDEQKVKLRDIRMRMDTTSERAKISLRSKLEQQKGAITDKYIIAARDGRNAVYNVKVELAEGEMDYSDELVMIAVEMTEFGKLMAANELQKPAPNTTKKNRSFIEDNVYAIIDEQIARLRLRLQELANRALQNNLPENDLKRQLDQEFDAFFDKALPPTIDKVVPDALNYGRGITFDRYKGDLFAYRYTAILDAHTTEYCRSLDGRVFQSNDPNYIMLTPPNHYGCRSIWTPITKVEQKANPVRVDGKPLDVPVYSSVGTFKDIS